jgi:hypothetical protein
VLVNSNQSGVPPEPEDDITSVINRAAGAGAATAARAINTAADIPRELLIGVSLGVNLKNS